MLGETYFQHYLTVSEHMKEIQGLPMAIQASGRLAITLATMYFDEGLEGIGSLPEPNLIKSARETIAESSATGTARIKKYLAEFETHQEKIISTATEREIKGITDPEELKAFASLAAERDSLNASIAEHHNGMLSRALLTLQKQGLQGKLLDQARVAYIVKDEINRQRKPLAQMLSPWQCILLAHYDQSPMSKAEAFSLDVIRKRGTATPPWLQRTNNPDGPGQLLASFLSETEMLVVLNEWVIERELPYMPIVSPVFFETGSYDHRGRNPHADLFLCSLLPNHNDIIPIQIKKIHKPQHQDDYIEDMVFLTPEDIGQYELGHAIMKVNGRAVTGQRYTLRYGAISTQFMKLHNRAKGKQPTKVDREVYAAQLQTAFEGLDKQLGNIVQRA